MASGFHIPDGNDALRDDLPAVVELIERTARWVNPETFRRLPVWAPHTARGRPLYDAAWSRRYTNTKKATKITAEKFEGNVAALNALVAALGVAAPKPKNWTVCHIWGYDDPSFAQQSSVVPIESSEHLPWRAMGPGWPAELRDAVDASLAEAGGIPAPVQPE